MNTVIQNYLIILILQHFQTYQQDFITMSVKDKIAMWNNMTTANNPPLNAPKTTVSTFVSRPQPQQQEPHRVSDHQALKHGVDTTPIVKPSELRKKAQMEQSSPISKTPEYVIKPIETSYKAPEPIKKENSSSSNNGNQFTVDAPTVPKPSDIKKQFQQQISGNNFHFIAPVPIKKVESVTIDPKPEGGNVVYEVEKEVPRVSVKQSAEKLRLFYQKKSEEHQQPKQIIPQVHEEKHEKETEHHGHHEHHKHQQHHKSHQQVLHHQEKPVPKAQENQFILPQQPQQPPPSSQQPETQSQQSTQQMDLALRLKNRNKKKRVNFDSDDD